MQKKNFKPYFKEMVIKAKKMKPQIVPFKDKIYQSCKPSNPEVKKSFFLKRKKTIKENEIYSSGSNMST